MGAAAAMGKVMALCALAPALSFSATYYLDCQGQDNRPGTSPGEAWQTLGKGSSASLKPGDKLLLKRGCTWKGPLTLGWSGTAEAPITVGAFGEGSLPEIQNGNPGNVMVNGSYILVESLSAKSDPVRTDAGCQDQPVGDLSGFTFASGASYNILRHVRSTGHSRGVWMAGGSHHNRVLHSRISGNVSLTRNDPGGDNDAGAFGVLINGDDNEVAYDTLSGNFAWCSYDYGVDGASVEIYEAKRNRIHHNVSLDEGTFTELGGARTDDNVFAYNLVVSKRPESIFLNVRGRMSKWGPNLKTVSIHNTVYLTGAQSQGIICGGGCAADILVAQNNLIWAEGKILWADAPFKESHNLFWKTGGNPVIQGITLHPASRRADPAFSDAAQGDFTLRSGSPAVDGGAAEVAQYGYLRDLAGQVVPGGAAPDVGSFELYAVSGSGVGVPSALSRARPPFLGRGVWAFPRNRSVADARGRSRRN